MAAGVIGGGHQAGTIPWSTSGALFYFNDFLEAWTTHVGTAYDQSWSLAVEEQFYLVWPFVLALIATRLAPLAQRRATVALVAGSVAIWLLFGNYSLPTGHLVPLALGCWAAFWLSGGAERGRLGPIPPGVGAGCVPGGVRGGTRLCTTGRSWRPVVVAGGSGRHRTDAPLHPQR